MSCVSAAQDGGCGCALAEGAVDFGLEGVEFSGGFGFGFVVAGYGDVDDGAGGDIWGEEDGGEFDLGSAVSMVCLCHCRLGRLRRGIVLCWGHTRRLSSVSRTATPASTLPTVRETSIVNGSVGY